MNLLCDKELCQIPDFNQERVNQRGSAAEERRGSSLYTEKAALAYLCQGISMRNCSTGDCPQQLADHKGSALCPNRCIQRKKSLDFCPFHATSFPLPVRFIRGRAFGFRVLQNCPVPLPVFLRLAGFQHTSRILYRTVYLFEHYFHLIRPLLFLILFPHSLQFPQMVCITRTVGLGVIRLQMMRQRIP